MAHRWTPDLKAKDVTDEALFLNRRTLLAGIAGTGLGTALAPPALASEEIEPNSWDEITSYNNFY